MRSTSAGSGVPSRAMSPAIPHTPQGYSAVVSCHVERPLDDRCWGLFAALQRRFPIAAVMRPPDEAAGERWEPWVARARAAAALGPLGHHTHWTSPTHARPTGGDPGARVLEEGAWIREQGLEPRFYCGGGWYFDAGVAAAAARPRHTHPPPPPRRPAYP